MSDWTDPFFRWRYGVTGDEKYRLALSGRIPGSQPIQSEADIAREERRAAAYLFSLQHPSIADFGTGVASTIRGYFGEPEALQAVAREGVVAGRTQPRSLKDLMRW